MSTSKMLTKEKLKQALASTFKVISEDLKVDDQIEKNKARKI